jgi:Concanavalin A-like lectin/glucanases superfamily
MRVLALSLAVVVLLIAAAISDATPPCCAPVPAGLVAWWPADDSGADRVGGHDATLNGGVTYVDAKVGSGWSFDSVDDYVSVADHPDFIPGTDSFSVDAWIRTTDETDGQIIRHYECAGFCTNELSSSSWDLRVVDHHAFGFVRDADKGGPVDQGEGQNIAGATVVDDGVFHHIALVRDQAAGHLRLYVDGALDGDQPLNAGASGALSDLDGDADAVTIGGGILGGQSTPDPDVEFTGVIDEVDWWRTALTGDQVAAIAAAGANGKCTDEVAPASSATAPATSAAGAPISVAYSASDSGGSGLARVVLLVRTPGASGFTEAATDTSSSGSGTFSYTPAAGPGDYGFATAAEDANCGREAPPAQPDAVTKVAAAPTGAPSSAPPPAKSVPITQLATLPSTHVCVSRRHFRIHIKGVKGVLKAVIKLTGVPARTVKGRALGLPVDLRGLPKGKVVVRITITRKTGKRLVGKRTYHTCASRRIVKKKRRKG